MKKNYFCHQKKWGLSDNDFLCSFTLIAGLTRNPLRKGQLSSCSRDGGCSSAMRVKSVDVVVSGLFSTVQQLNNQHNMTPIVSIIMGSTSDLPVLEKAAQFFDEMEIPFEMNALSAHRTPQEVETFAREAQGRGIKVIIAAAGMAAALPGVIAANTTLPVIGVPVKGMLDGLDAMLSIIQMPPGIPVATVGVNGALNAAILAAEMLALGNAEIAAKVANYKENLKNKITKANAELKEVQYKFKTN